MLPGPPDNASGPAKSSAWNAGRTIACCAALLGLGASLWAALGTTDCSACHPTRGLALPLPLAWLGVAFYALLAFTIATWQRSRWTLLAFFAASGVHVVLLALLFLEHRLCIPCITAALAAILGALSAAATPPLPKMVRPVAAFLLAALLTVAATTFGHSLQSPTRHPQPANLAATSQNASTAASVTLILYEREGCKHCLDFEENVLPQIQQTFGQQIHIQRLDAEIDMETPTIIVQGKTTRTFAGGGDVQTLEDAIRESLASTSPASSPPQTSPAH